MSARRLLSIAPLLLSLGCASAWPARADATGDVAALDSWAAAGAREVVESLADWKDAARDRTLPVKLYVPAGQDACPVVLLSHGLGGSREGLSYLARPWAARGYLCVVMQHPGSDESVWKGERPLAVMAAMRRAAADPRNALDRARDVTFVLDRLAKETADPASPLHGRADLERVAIAGHSFGAWTALTAGGRKVVPPSGPALDLGDPRIDCVIALSSQATGDEARDRASLDGLRRPTLHMTGTLDESPIGETTAAQRRIPFDLAPGPADGGAAQYLVVLDGGDHRVFGGDARRSGPLARRSGADPANDPAFHRAIVAAATAFLEANLRGDAAARAFLDDDAGFRRALGPLGTFERKVAAPR